MGNLINNFKTIGSRCSKRRRRTRRRESDTTWVCDDRLWKGWSISTWWTEAGRPKSQTRRPCRPKVDSASALRCQCRSTTISRHAPEEGDLYYVNKSHIVIVIVSKRTDQSISLHLRIRSVAASASHTASYLRRQFIRHPVILLLHHLVRLVVPELGVRGGILVVAPHVHGSSGLDGSEQQKDAIWALKTLSMSKFVSLQLGFHYFGLAEVVVVLISAKNVPIIVLFGQRQRSRFF